jgi:hypothetical protein
MTRPTKASFCAGLAVLVALLASASCRRSRFPPRGDAAAVVVVAPRRDAAPPPKVAELEPNDSPEQAQLLALGVESSAVNLEGGLAAGGDGKVKDVDVFKLVVPGERQAPAAAAVDSGPTAEDPRWRARRLSVEIAPQGGLGLGVQLLDETGRALEGIAVEAGAVGGMPNLAVSPGTAYFIRVMAAAKPAKGAVAQTAACSYRLTVQLGGFEVADEREPDGTVDTAIPVAVTGTVELAGYHGWPRDQDFYRIPLPETAAALDVELDPVSEVGASIQVLDGTGKHLASARGYRNEGLALRNVILQPPAADAPPTGRHVYVVVRAETGQNRERRYVLRLTLGLPKLDAEVEPNDKAESATSVRDGTYSGYLTSGDVDWYRYQGEGQRDVSFEVSFPARVRGKIESFRPGELPAGAVETRKPRQVIALAGVASLGQPLLLRVSARKGDGNANEPYLLRISSVPSAAPPVPPAHP